MSDEIYGVTFPIPKSLVGRFLEDGKTVFIKPATVYAELKTGMLFVIYQSQEDSGYIAEGVIKKIKICDDPLDFFEEFGDAIFLTKTEVKNYIKNTENWRSTKTKIKSNKRKWIAIELGKIKKYKEIQKPEKFVSVAGNYLKK